MKGERMKHEINDTVLVPMKVVRILDSEDGKVLQLGAAFCNETKSYAVDILESELDPIHDGEMSNKDAAEIIKIAIAEVEWEYPMDYAAAFDRAIEALEVEPLTDTEQRIFLAAMTKEEKVCKEVCADGSDGGVNLVAVCHRIERKVKRALWG